MTRRPQAWSSGVIAVVLASATYADAQSSSDDRTPPAWSIELFAGAGVGSRELDLPEDDTVYRTRTGLFPAAEVGFTLAHVAARGLRLGLAGRYQSSVGLHILERHTDGSARRQSLRSHRFELAFAPALDLDGEGQWALLGSLGYGLVDVRPEVHLWTPGYGLGGPYLRVELQVPLGSERLRLRLGPEAQWVVQVGDELVHRGVDTHGVGVGATASIELVVTGFIIDAGYRELRVFLDSAYAGSAADLSRFVTVRLRGTL